MPASSEPSQKPIMQATILVHIKQGELSHQIRNKHIKKLSVNEYIKNNMLRFPDINTNDQKMKTGTDRIFRKV